ncbi:MAG TPA: hypothetical protein VGL59_09135 [Polyangia bacterium]|jgi:hypothetical protein
MSIAAVPVFLASAVARAQAPAAPPADAPPAAAAPTPPPAPEPPTPPPPVAQPRSDAMPAGMVNKFSMQVYGFAELDTWHDNVLNAGEGVGNSLIGKTGTQNGDNGRWVWTARNSRFGFRVKSPDWEGMKASANIETDFGGGPAGGAPPALGGAAAAPVPYSNVYGNEAGYTTTGVLRLRHAYVKMETPYVDITAGQTWDVFGWGVVPFLANGPEYQGITGQIYHRNPELRLDHRFVTDAVVVQLAVAAARPFQRDSSIPDFEGGLKVELPMLKGVHVVGAGKPGYDAAAIGVSGIYRSFKTLQHPALAATDTAPAELSYDKSHGWGVAGDLFLPIVGATMEDQSNALAITGEVGLSSGVGDFYGNPGTGLQNAPALRAASAAGVTPAVAAIPYPQNFDNGVLAWNPMTNALVPIKLLAFTAGAQYHLPVYDGKLLWLAANVGYMKLQDVGSYGIAANSPAVMKQDLWIDGSLFASLGPAAHVGVNYATYQNTFQDSSKSARLQRLMVALYFFF